MRRYSSVIGMVMGVVILLGLGYYIRYRASSLPSSETNSSNQLPTTNVNFGTPTNAVPTGSAAGTFEKALDASVIAFHVNPSGEIIYLDMVGQVVRYKKGGQPETLSSSPLPDVRAARFSLDGSYLLMGYGAKVPQWSVFDIAKKTWQPLVGSVLDAAWSPSDNRLAYISANGIEVMNFAATKPQPQLIERVVLAEAKLAWPSPRTLIISERPSGDIHSSIWSFDLQTKNVGLLGEYTAYHGIWNFNASRAVVFRGNSRGRGGTLYETDAGGNNARQFNFLTLPSKCVFSSEIVPVAATTSTSRAATSTIKEFLNCAVPRDQDRLFALMMPDAWLKRDLFTEDDMYKIDLGSGALKPLILRGATVFDAEALQVQNGRIFFRNRLDGKIYSMAQD